MILGYILCKTKLDVSLYWNLRKSESKVGYTNYVVEFVGQIQR